SARHSAAPVFDRPPGGPNPDESIVSSPTGPDGHYTILGLEEGTYDVLAMKGGVQASVTGVSVVPGPPTVVDIVLPAAQSGGVAGLVQMDNGTGTLVPVP